MRYLVYVSDFESFSEINEEKLDCIFAETGADRELDFEREAAERLLFYEIEINLKQKT